MVLVFIMVFSIIIFHMEFILSFSILILLFIAYLKMISDVVLIEEYYLYDVIILNLFCHETILNLLIYYEPI